MLGLLRILALNLPERTDENSGNVVQDSQCRRRTRTRDIPNTRHRRNRLKIACLIPLRNLMCLYTICSE